eukprot:TRINITY_DN2914_c0_g1_i1.p1 TRINITY_DN2914_c0_g1~~TRINITY_DN2914_c0_g1_i1.p1  ORF type:complete len:147 (-),score=41.33 TRINITY_DN2914_c0_g1_i1:152-592(-)
MDEIQMYSKLVNALLAANTIWRGGSAFFLSFKGRGILHRYSYVRPVGDLSVDLLKWLGGMNAACALLSFLGLRRSIRTQEIRGTELWILAATNVTQCFCFLLSLRSGRWSRDLAKVAVPEGLLAIFNFILALLTLRYHRNVFIRDD